MIGARLTDATGDYEVVGFSEGRYVVARLDTFQTPEALEPGEIARRFSVAVAEEEAPEADGVEAYPGEARGWKHLAEAQERARTLRPADAPTPEEVFTLTGADAQRLGHR